jgi:hypothetical protein
MSTTTGHVTEEVEAHGAAPTTEEEAPARPGDLTRRWYADVDRELAEQHGLTAARIPKGVLVKLFTRGLEPAEAADQAKIEYDNARPQPKWARRRGR